MALNGEAGSSTGRELTPAQALQPSILTTWQRWKSILRIVLGRGTGAPKQISIIMVSALSCSPELHELASDGLPSRFGTNRPQFEASADRETQCSWSSQ